MNKLISWFFKELELQPAYLITPFYSGDIRGGFLKDYSKELFESHGIKHDLKEVFYTYSHKGVIRAIHFQRTKQQAKLVRCIKGKIFDVIVDLRVDSPTFMKWQGFYLTEKNLLQILVPEGFGHGYLVLEDSIVSYKCAEKFYPEYDDGIKYNDLSLSIKWPFDEINGEENLIISEKDKNLKSISDFMNI